MKSLVERLRDKASLRREFWPKGELAILLEEAANELDAKQAQIDRLMFEYCPEEMTEDQIKTWADHQQPIFDELHKETMEILKND